MGGVIKGFKAMKLSLVKFIVMGKTVAKSTSLTAVNALTSYYLGQPGLDYHGNGSRTVYICNV